MAELYSADLEDDTAFERLFLSTAYPLADSGVWESAGTYDLAKRKVVKQLRSALDNLGTTPESARELLLIHPLAFGAAWKVLDLMLEYAFEAAGQTPSGKRWWITEKVQLARNATGQADPLTSDQPVWKALSSLYAETYETRHSLVHRGLASCRTVHSSGWMSKARVFARSPWRSRNRRAMRPCAPSTL